MTAGNSIEVGCMNLAMTNRPPPKASKFLATPIENVEDSRAQRLLRQQSRFRDRGGIFVPSSRNKLADILLGKASPVKKLTRRSTSASPSKGHRKGGTRAQSNTPVAESECRKNRSTRGASVVNGGDPPFSLKLDLRKPASLRVSSKTPNAIGDSDDVDGALGKRRKRGPVEGTRQSKKGPKPDEESSQNEGDHTVVKSKGATKGNSTPRSAARSKPSKSTETASPAGAKRKTGSKAGKKSGPRASRSNKKSLSESTSQQSQARSKPCVPQLPDIMEEDEDNLSDHQLNSLPDDSRDNSAPELQTGKKRAIQTVDAPAESPERPQKRAKALRSESESKLNAIATSKERLGKTKGNDKVSKMPDRDAGEECSTHRSQVKGAKRKKGDEDQASNYHPGGKRQKVKGRTEPEDELPTPKKATRKTHKEWTCADINSAKTKATKTAINKENTKVAVKLPYRRGPPKSVLLLLQNSSTHHIIDDEPDPIDFLSTPRRRPQI